MQWLEMNKSFVIVPTGRLGGGGCTMIVITAMLCFRATITAFTVSTKTALPFTGCSNYAKRLMILKQTSGDGPFCFVCSKEVLQDLKNPASLMFLVKQKEFHTCWGKKGLPL